MLICSKLLQCEALYQMMAAMLASWFRRRSTAEVFEQKLNALEQTQEAPKLKFQSQHDFHKTFPYLFDPAQRKNYEL